MDCPNCKHKLEPIMMDNAGFGYGKMENGKLVFYQPRQISNFGMSLHDDKHGVRKYNFYECKECGLQISIRERDTSPKTDNFGSLLEPKEEFVVHGIE